MPQTVNLSNLIYTQYTSPLPYLALKILQLIEKGTTNLLGSLSNLNDDNGDSLPELFLSIEYTNQNDIFKSYYWTTRGTKPGFNVIVENKLASSNNTLLLAVTQPINLSHGTYTFSFLLSYSTYMTVTLEYQLLNLSNLIIQDWLTLAFTLLFTQTDGTQYYSTFTTPLNTLKIKFRVKFITQATKSLQGYFAYPQLEAGQYWTSFTNSSRPDGKIFSTLGYNESVTLYGYFFLPASKRNLDGVIISLGQYNLANSISLFTTNTRLKLKVSVRDQSNTELFLLDNILYDPNGWTYFLLAYQKVSASQIKVKLYINDTKLIDQTVNATINYNDTNFQTLYIGYLIVSAAPLLWFNGFLSAVQFNGSYLSDEKILQIYNDKPLYTSTKLLSYDLRNDLLTLNGLPAASFSLVGHSHNDLYFPRVDLDNRYVYKTGDTITGLVTINGLLSITGRDSTTGLNLNNADIINVNSIHIADPEPGEGLIFDGGNGWKIYESPNDLTTNSSGNLQFVKGTTRVLTLDTSNNLYFLNDVTITGDIKTGSDTYIWTNGSGTGYTGIWDQKNSKILLQAKEDRTIQLGDSTSLITTTHYGTLKVQDGTLKVQGISSQLQIGDVSGDDYILIFQIPSGTYGLFSDQNGNASIIRNEQGTINQYIFLGDTNPDSEATLFGVGIYLNSDYSRLRLTGSGNLYLSGELKGNLLTLTTLQTLRTILISGGATGTLTSFDGSLDISINVTQLDLAKLSGTVAVLNGGTGLTTFTSGAILTGNGTSLILTPGPTLNLTTLTFGGAGTINSTTTSLLTLDSGTTGLINIGTNLYAKTITIGNTTGATSLILNSGTGGITVNQVASGIMKIQASALPTTDMLQITNSGKPNVTAGVNALDVLYYGGAANVEASALRIELFPGTTSGGIWSALRIVPSTFTAGVTTNGVKFENITSGNGTENMIYAGTGWDNILNYNGTTIINGSGNVIAGQLSGTIPSLVLGNSTVYVGTTLILLNRLSGSLLLTGITSIDGSAAKLTTARTILIGGGATGTLTSFDGTLDITINVTSIDLSKVNGTLPALTLANSTVYVGTTLIPLNRTSGTQDLTGISSISGLNSITVGNFQIQLDLDSIDFVYLG